MKVGLYRHYKGGTYLVLGIAHDANADTIGNSTEQAIIGYELDDRVKPFGSREVVVYVGLDRGDKPGTPMAVRTLEDFNQKLCGVRVYDDKIDVKCCKPLDSDDRCPEHEYTNTPPVRRFEYVGPRD